MKKALIFLTLTFIFLLGNLFAQVGTSSKVDSYTADQKFLKGNYEGALDEYFSLLENDAKNDNYNYNIGICYLNTNINKTKAIPYLESVIHQAKYDPNAMYLLGRAYHFAYRFDDAIKAYSAFKQEGKGNEDNLKDADLEIQFCINAKELMKYPLDISFQNLGANINSPYADYYSFLPDDESFIVFNTKRPEEGASIIKEDGTYTSAIYIAKAKDGAFIKSKPIGAPIAIDKGELEVIGLSRAGNTMLLYYVNTKGVGDIYVSSLDKDERFKKSEKLEENINSSKASEIAACINNDGTLLYFASDRADGIGGTDVYVSHKLPNGKWGPAKNAGKEINTPYNEDFPMLSSDEKTLYFSSNGHTSIGGYDIFKAELDEATQQYVNPKNVGYPINTPEDNFKFQVSGNGRYGYLSALRDGGMGDLDIYRITFNEVDPLYSVVKGDIVSSDSTQKIHYANVFITVTDSKSQKIIGNYLPNPSTGHYVMALAPGTYNVSIEATGFKTVNEKISVLDKNSYRFEITKDIELNPKGQ